jgi:hypothetical protein
MSSFSDGSNRKEGVGTKDWEYVAVILNLKALQEANNSNMSGVSKVQIVYSGKDAENWQGYYGICFANESIRVKFKNEDGSVGRRSLVKRMKYRRSYTSLPFGTFFNDGMGALTFFDGIPHKQKQNNIADYDITATYTLQHKIINDNILKSGQILVKDAVVKIDSMKAFNGNTSYSISWKTECSNEVLIHKLFKTDIRLSEEITIYSAIWEQDIGNVFWLLKFSNGEYKKLSIGLVEVKNKWMIGNAKFLGSKNTLKGIYLLVEGLKSNVKYQISLGHFAMATPKSHWVEDSKSTGKITRLEVQSNPKTLLTKKGKEVIDVQAEWEFEASIPLIHCYRVYL